MYLFTPKKNELLPYLPTGRSQPDFVLPNEEGKGLEELIIYVTGVLEKRYEKLVMKIVDSLILPQGVEFWRAAAKAGKPITLKVPSNNRG